MKTYSPITDLKELEQAKKELRTLCEKNEYRVLVINTSMSTNLDNPETKVFALLVGSQQLNPLFLARLGFDTFYKEKPARQFLFYNPVIGISRAFGLVYELSAWLFNDGYKLKAIY